MRADGDRLRLIVHGDVGPDLDGRLTAFEAICRKRRGLRLERRTTDVIASVDPARIEEFGPLVEAAAAANELRVTLADLGAEVRSAGLDAGPARLWAAIGNAADELELARGKGEEATGDVFRYVRVETIDGVRTAHDDRPPLVEPIGSGPMDFGPTKYDDVDYHEGAAAEAGQPRENAFAHIGMYLAWIIRHDLHDPRWFPIEHIAAVKRGEMTGTDLADDTDWKLLSDLMTPEGAAFSDARYETYLHEYGELFADTPQYGVAEDMDRYATVEALIDGLYADWIAAGRPAAEPTAPSPMVSEVEAMFESADIPWEEITAGATGLVEVQLNADGSYEVRRPELPHADPDLEALVPPDLLSSPIEMSSGTGTNHGSSLLSRALKEVGVRPRLVTIAHGLAGDGDRTFGLTLYRVPGASASALSSAFATAIIRPRKTEWQIRRVGDTDVWWAEGYADADRTFLFRVAYWTRDDLVLHVFGMPEDMETAIRRLG